MSTKNPFYVFLIKNLSKMFAFFEKNEKKFQNKNIDKILHSNYFSNKNIIKRLWDFIKFEDCLYFQKGSKIYA